MTTAGLWRYGDWRHVATGCTAVVLCGTLKSATHGQHCPPSTWTVGRQVGTCVADLTATNSDCTVVCVSRLRAAVTSIESGCPDDGGEFTRHVTSASSAHARFIASPNYPDRYFRQAVCRWRLAVQASQTIRLTLVDFELDVRRDGVCHDQLTIMATASGSGHVIFSDCGALGKQVTPIMRLN